jgi:hypothetical protein
MRIGSEAPKRRTHSSIRHESQGASRDSATSNRYRRPVTSVWTRPKLSGCLQRPPFIVPHAKRRRPGQCPPARAATGRSVACAAAVIALMTSMQSSLRSGGANALRHQPGRIRLRENGVILSDIDFRSVGRQLRTIFRRRTPQNGL